MKMAEITRLLVLFNFFTFLTLSGTEMFFVRPVPVFSKTDAFSGYKKLLPPGYHKIKSGPIRSFSQRPPLAYYSEFYELEAGGFVSPEVSADKDGKVYFSADFYDWRICCAGLLTAILVVFTVIFIKEKIKKKIPPDSPLESAGLIMIAIALRLLFVLFEIAYWNNGIPASADEPGYFNAIYDILNGNFSGPWHFTAGLGIIYAPFILLLNASEYHDIAVVFSHFNALVIAPAAMAMAFLVLKNFRFHRYCAFAAVLLWGIYPFFVYHKELWNVVQFEPVIALSTSLEATYNWWKYYAVCINAGFNGMSDMPGLMAVFCTVFMAQKMQITSRNTFFLGILYGFCCLVRINYILFAPLIAFIWFRRNITEKNLTAWRICAAAAGGFFLIFGWQLLINFYQFGNPLTFGYSLHYLDFPPEKRPDTGFSMAILLEMKNISFLTGANKILMVAGIAGLLWMKERYSRISLTLFAVPLILFFFGYSHTYCDARRFIMAAFPIFLGACCAASGDVFFFSQKNLFKDWHFGGFLISILLLWFIPTEIYAICLVLLLLRSVLDLQQELTWGILRK